MSKWQALERAVAEAGLPLSTCTSFMWMCERGGVHQYKHRDTRNYAMLRGNESKEECIIALAHAQSMVERWADRPRMSWEVVHA